jgi:kynurenine formamidase
VTSKPDAGFPGYSELLQRTDSPPGSSWGLFGADDEVGMANFAGPEQIVAAARLVSRGRVFNLDFAINAFSPPLVPYRPPARHNIYSRHADHRDDWLDSFYLQSTSQIDGLRHRRHFEHGFYNRTPDDGVADGSPTLGVNRWAERGLVGRGVLADVDRHLRSARGRPLDHRRGEAFGPEVVDEALRAQGVELQPGDILLIRTGWASFYFGEMTAEEKAAFSADLRCPGLAQSRETLAWLWEHRFAMVAADNLGLEAVPAVPTTPIPATADGGLMHQEMIALLGLAIGELWALDDLAEDCAADGRYEFLLVSKPLNLIGGVGSPPNAVAIK